MVNCIHVGRLSVLHGILHTGTSLICHNKQRTCAEVWNRNIHTYESMFESLNLLTFLNFSLCPRHCQQYVALSYRKQLLLAGSYLESWAAYQSVWER